MTQCPQYYLAHNISNHSYKEFFQSEISLGIHKWPNITQNKFWGYYVHVIQLINDLCFSHVTPHSTAISTREHTLSNH